MKRKQRKSLPWKRFGYMIVIKNKVIKFGELLLWIFPRIISMLSEAISNTRKSGSSDIETLRSWFKKLGPRVVFSTHFSVFGCLIKHFLEFDILLNFVRPAKHRIHLTVDIESSDTRFTPRSPCLDYHESETIVSLRLFFGTWTAIIS